MLNVYNNGRRDQPKVALTFDDGPNPYCTEAVLDILAEKQVRATFFVIGSWVEFWPDVLRKVAEHHIVGNHSYLHEYPANDYQQAEDAIYRVLNQYTDYVRIPFFREPSPELKRWIDKRVCIGSDVWSRDWEPQVGQDPKAIFDLVCNNMNLKNGSIINLHDGAECINHLRLRPRPMIDALPHIIDELQRRGYELVGMDEMDFTGV